MQGKEYTTPKRENPAGGLGKKHEKLTNNKNLKASQTTQFIKTSPEKTTCQLEAHLEISNAKMKNT